MLCVSFPQCPAVKPGSHLDLAVRSYGEPRGTHVHDYFQVLWALQGTLDLEIEGKGAALSQGEALLLRPGERHDFESRQGSRCLVLDTRDPLWANRPVRPLHAQAVHHLACYLAAAMEQQPQVPGLGLLLLGQSWGGLQERRRSRRDVDWAELTRWVLANLAHPLSAADLAARVFLSESRFRRRCVESLGCSPMQWVRALRLEQARALRAAGLSAAEAARRVGYRSVSAMRAAMKESEAPR